MNRKDTNPSANVPMQDPEEPYGDRGRGDKTWVPDEGEQGISNRPDDQGLAAQTADDEDEDDEFEDDDEDDAEADDDPDEKEEEEEEE